MYIYVYTYVISVCIFFQRNPGILRNLPFTERSAGSTKFVHHVYIQISTMSGGFSKYGVRQSGFVFLLCEKCISGILLSSNASLVALGSIFEVRSPC